jgi:hypothetical protein
MQRDLPVRAYAFGAHLVVVAHKAKYVDGPSPSGVGDLPGLVKFAIRHGLTTV